MEKTHWRIIVTYEAAYEFARTNDVHSPPLMSAPGFQQVLDAAAELTTATQHLRLFVSRIDDPELRSQYESYVALVFDAKVKAELALANHDPPRLLRPPNSLYDALRSLISRANVLLGYKTWRPSIEFADAVISNVSDDDGAGENEEAGDV